MCFRHEALLGSRSQLLQSTLGGSLPSFETTGENLAIAINPAVQSYFLTLASHFATNVTRACHIENHTPEGGFLSPLKSFRHTEQSYTHVPTTILPRCQLQDVCDLIYVGYTTNWHTTTSAPSSATGESYQQVSRGLQKPSSDFRDLHTRCAVGDFLLRMQEG